jgi:hypothetical protein
MSMPDRGTESGVALVLALICMTALSLVLLAIGTTTTNDLVNSGNLKSQHALEYAADGATSLAMQTVRYGGTTWQTAGVCLPTGNSVTINSVAIWVTCSAQTYDPVSGVTRVINFWACKSTSCSASSAVVSAQVTFDDYDSANNYNCTPGVSVSTCGSAQTINSWIIKTGDN